MEFTRVDTPGYERFVSQWHGVHRRRTRFERFAIEMGNLNLVLVESRVPLYDRPCCRSVTLEFSQDEELDCYAKLALHQM